MCWCQQVCIIIPVSQPLLNFLGILTKQIHKKSCDLNFLLLYIPRHKQMLCWARENNKHLLNLVLRTWFLKSRSEANVVQINCERDKKFANTFTNQHLQTLSSFFNQVLMWSVLQKDLSVRLCVTSFVMCLTAWQHFWYLSANGYKC